MSVTALLSEAQCRVHQPWVPGDLTAWLWHWLICWLVSHWKWLILSPCRCCEGYPVSRKASYNPWLKLATNTASALLMSSALLVPFHRTKQGLFCNGSWWKLIKAGPKNSNGSKQHMGEPSEKPDQINKGKKQCGLSPFASHPVLSTTSNYHYQPIDSGQGYATMPGQQGPELLLCHLEMLYFPNNILFTPLTGSPDLPDH